MRAWIIASLVFGLLSCVAFIPDALVIAAFLMVVPMLVLGIAPNAFLLCLAALVGRMLAGGDRPLRRLLFWVPIALLVAGSFGISTYFNRDLRRQVQALQQGDTGMRAPLPPFHQLALRMVGATQHRAPVVPDLPQGRGKRHRAQDAARQEYFTQAGICDNTCLDLLYGGIVSDVLVSSVAPGDADTVPGVHDPATRFHVEHLEECPPVLFQIGPQTMTLAWAKAHQVKNMSFVAPALQRMVQGECLVPEPATLDDADTIVQTNDLVLPRSSNLNHPSAKNILQLRSAPLSALRTTIYAVSNGVGAEVVRRTSVRSYPLAPLLVCLPAATGEGGIGISEGWLRFERIDNDYLPRDLLKTVLGVDIPNLTTRSN